MSEERETFVVPDDIWVAAQRAFERGSTIGIAQAILEERERCSSIVADMANRAHNDTEIFEALGVIGVGRVMAHAIDCGLHKAARSAEEEQSTGADEVAK
ncbi:MAG: hypothetical protein EKK41_23185 [Hyphomicrobiales bacterium]|nr:MAG: hypothetical protein EKK41_23185 [Hyphomicrobiales bacterium]